jgi:iron complex outermembrane receptor protein
MAQSTGLNTTGGAYLVVVAALGLAPVAAMAQLEEVIVTAQKREQSLQDVSGTVNVYSGEELNSLASFQLSDLSKISAGLAMFNSTNTNVAEIIIRGFGSSSPNGQQQAAAVFINGGVQSDASSALNGLLDVERIEVLRGPQGTLYGKNAPTGAINIWTRRPDLEEFGGELGLTLAENSESRGEGILNIPLMDNLGVRLAGMKHQSDSYIDNTFLNEDAIDFDRDIVQGTFLWLPTDAMELNLYARYLNADSTSLLTSLFDYPAQGDDIWDFDVSQNTAGDGKQEDKSYVLNFTWEIGDSMDLDAVTAYQDFDNSFYQDRDARSDIVDFVFIDQSSETFSQEIRLSFTNDNWDLMLGVFYSDFDQDSEVDAELEGGLVRTQILGTSTSSENESVFTNNTYRFNDIWSVTLGARYGEDTGKSKGLQTIRLDALPSLNRDIDLTTNRNNDKTSYSVKLTYQPQINVTTYLAYDTAYRLGGRNALVSPAFKDAGFGKFPDEESNAWELGIKSFLLDNRMSVNAAVYYQTYDDFQIGTFSPGYQLGTDGPVLPDTSRINAPADDAESYGFELEAAYAPDEHWRFTGNFAYNSIEVNGYTGPGVVDSGPIVDGIVQRTLDGQQLGRAAQTDANVTVAYSDHFSNGLQWTARALTTYTGSIDNEALDAQPNDLTDDSTLVEAFFDVESVESSWLVTLWVKNVFDEDYILGGRSTLEDGGGIPGQPRTFGVSGRYRF